MNGKRGIVLLSVVVILLTVALIGTSLVAFFSSVSLSATTIVDEAKALYLAEAGIAHAIYMLHNQAGIGGELAQDIGPVHLGEGTYVVNLDLVQSMITATGQVGGMEKTVQLQYSSL